jgi:hypothetical protein
LVNSFDNYTLLKREKKVMIVAWVSGHHPITTVSARVCGLLCSMYRGDLSGLKGKHLSGNILGGRC